MGGMQRKLASVSYRTIDSLNFERNTAYDHARSNFVIYVAF